MRTGTKASLVKTLKEETKVSIITHLPHDDKKTAVIVDAMYALRNWCFHKGETFGTIAKRYYNLLLNDVPAGTDIGHFCCDRYSDTSLKSREQGHRCARLKPGKVYEVSEQFQAPGPYEVFAVSATKANLLSFLCENRCENEQVQSTFGSSQLYLGGGFTEQTKSVMLTAGSVVDIPALESIQQEADTRLILHALYSVKNNGVDRVVIHANDTDIITTCLFYGATYLSDLSQLWVRTARDAYLPIHEMVAALGPSQCRAMPFIHSLSGRDTTSYPYFTGKMAWFKKGTKVDITALEEFGENSSYAISDDLIKQARDLTVPV